MTLPVCPAYFERRRDRPHRCGRSSLELAAPVAVGTRQLARAREQSRVLIGELRERRVVARVGRRDGLILMTLSARTSKPAL